MKEEKFKKSIHISRKLMEEINKMAEENHRSANGQIIYMLESYKKGK
ncbi:MAG: Arc family DNA-binding protein [Desulfobacteraceae bacterium]|nr:Arc family DNA-binding protein [Desulfobacteraceae bacterium]